MLTINGPVLLSSGQTFVGRMRLTPLGLPNVQDGQAVINNVLTGLSASDGTLTLVGSASAPLTLAIGLWMVSFPSAGGAGPLYLNVTSESGSANFGDLLILDGQGGTVVTGQLATGSGSPEGVVTARLGSPYWDYTNKAFYVKDVDGGNTGWRLLIS